MSWTKRLFKSRSGAPEPDPRLRWFGKLPTYPDYYRSQAADDWPDEFHNWVLQGFEMYKGRAVRDARSLARLPVSACVLRLPKSDMTIFCSVLDFGGDMRGRPFPMCFYVGMPTSRWGGPTSDRIRAATDILDRLVNLERDVARFLNQPGHFESLFSGREIDLYDIEQRTADDSWTQSGKSLDMARWFNGIRAGVDASRFEEWQGVITAWGDNIAGHNRKGFEPTLRFPLAQRVPTSLQVAGWFRWLERRMDISKRVVSFTITGDLRTESGALTIVSREILPDDFLLLTPMFASLPYLDDSCALGNSKAPADQAPPSTNLDGPEARTTRDDDQPESQPAPGAPDAAENASPAAAGESAPSKVDAQEDGNPPAGVLSDAGAGLSWSEFVQR